MKRVMTGTLDQLPASVRERIKAQYVYQSLRRPLKVFTDTSDFTSIDYGDVIVVGGRYFLVTAYTREGRFGVEEQVKQWVPRVLDLESGNDHIIKLVFHETFDITMGGFTIPCFRSPEKEARIIELVQGHDRFMQGCAIEDEAGNVVRVLDIIRGRRLDKVLFSLGDSHFDYFTNHVKAWLLQFIELARGIAHLHHYGFNHGDIRRDHVIVESRSGLGKWIDFDYDFYLPERPFALDIYELGNLLMFILGRDRYTPRDVLQHPDMGEKVLNTLSTDDLSLLAKNQIVNMRKLFPYIPAPLNDICMHFSQGTRVFYDSVDELLDDLEPCMSLL